VDFDGFEENISANSGQKVKITIEESESAGTTVSTSSLPTMPTKMSGARPAPGIRV
jgi:hypothetical protein